MESNTKSLSFFNIILYGLFKPAILWRNAVANKQYSSIWLILLAFTNMTALPYISGGAETFIKAVISINALLWLIIVTLWAFISAGLRVSGVNTTLSFKNLIRLVSYSSIVNVFYFLIQIVYTILYPKFFKTLKKTPNIKTESNVLQLIAFLFLLWFLAYIVIGVKELYRISYKRAILSVFFVISCVSLFIISAVILSKIS